VPPVLAASSEAMGTIVRREIDNGPAGCTPAPRQGALPVHLGGPARRSAVAGRADHS
jgi:hypothetical protein